PPAGVLEASTALPTQIYIWADSPERGFVSRTSAAILVLIGFLVVMNAIAIFLRQRFERRW
ncbi:MAG: phosphate ABC transporter, permease protein PstA, partial [Allorhizobium sp.]